MVHWPPTFSWAARLVVSVQFSSKRALLTIRKHKSCIMWWSLCHFNNWQADLTIETLPHFPHVDWLTAAHASVRALGEIGNSIVLEAGARPNRVKTFRSFASHWVLIVLVWTISEQTSSGATFVTEQPSMFLVLGGPTAPQANDIHAKNNEFYNSWRNYP